MQQTSIKRHFRITVAFANGKTRVVNVKAASEEVAEHRALKFVPNAVRVVKE